MSNAPQSSPRRALAAAIATALAVKAVALAVLYWAFFVPPTAVTSAATAVLGLPR